MKLVKTLLCTQLKQTNLEIESKKGFNETVFQHFVDELKHQFQYFCLSVKFMWSLCYLLE